MIFVLVDLLFIFVYKFLYKSRRGLGGFLKEFCRISPYHFLSRTRCRALFLLVLSKYEGFDPLRLLYSYLYVVRTEHKEYTPLTPFCEVMTLLICFRCFDVDLSKSAVCTILNIKIFTFIALRCCKNMTSANASVSLWITS